MSKVVIIELHDSLIDDFTLFGTYEINTNVSEYNRTITSNKGKFFLLYNLTYLIKYITVEEWRDSKLNKLGI